MRKTQNINLNLYDQSDTFNITGSQNSLNSNFEIIDEEINAINNTNSIDEVKNDVASLKENKIDNPKIADNGKIPRAKGKTVEWVEVWQPTDQQTEVAVKGWLDKHPEATTTVQDGAIGEQKISVDFLPWIKKDYVTPEMFGAVGDGVNDDTEAFNKMLKYKKK